MAEPTVLGAYAALVRSRVAAQTSYRASFSVDALVQVLLTVVEFAEVYVVFHQVDSLGGFSFAEVTLLYGLATTAFSLADLTVGHVDRLPFYVRTGQFDAFLLRPLSGLGQLVTSDFSLRRVGRLAGALAVLVAGLVAAKIWFAVLQPGPWRQSLARGWAVDGFLVAAPVTAIGLLLARGLPVGAFLDAAAPGMFVAVAIGRVGCFFTGCCAGRISHSRWSLWSSDRKVGARRLPAQLVESAVGLAIALGAGLLVVARAGLPEGLVFVAAFGAYAVARQLLLRIRAESRPFSWRRRSAAPTDTGSATGLVTDRG